MKALILTGYGINCDYETQHAFKQAGAEADRIHVADLITGEMKLADYDALVIPGGFSFGDDLGSGKVMAAKLRNHLGEQLEEFVKSEKLVLGICNGFQVLVNLGLLPGLGKPFTKQAALTFNRSGRFEDRWSYLSVNPDSPCVFTKEIERLYLPIRHGEGRFVADPLVLKKLKEGGQIVLQYTDAAGKPAAYPDNPNGSDESIAGICDPTGRIFGLMPHPEAAIELHHHPRWTRDDADGVPSRKLFTNAVEYSAKETARV
jgi:phosphoribosylformylglycinamidine synthase I